jgi:hypothetical protein
VESNGRFDSFDKDITRQLDGRYCTPIPWAIDKWRLEKNHQMASGRLQSMLNRLRKSPDDLANYTKEIEQLKTNKFVEEADIDYTTAHTDLLSVLLRFRLHKIDWIADIEKSFLNIALQPEDAEAIRFLWPKEPGNPCSELTALKWMRVPFGLSPSPFLLSICINKHLSSVKNRFPETVQQIEEQLYVDDYLGGNRQERKGYRDSKANNHSIQRSETQHAELRKKQPDAPTSSLRKRIEERNYRHSFSSTGRPTKCSRTKVGQQIR